MRFARLVFILFICVILAAPAREAVKAAAVPNCPPGGILGNPPINQVPTYDYGSEGLVQFHFRFTQAEWNYNTLKVGLYNENCVLESEPAQGQVGGSYLPPVKNLLVKVLPSEPGKYNFKVYDEDTRAFQGAGLGFVPNDFNTSNIGITLTNVTGSFNAPVVDTVATPVAPLHKPAQVPQRRPVLIIPGIMGTELFENQNLLWPNVNKMLADVGDDFLDVLAFNPNLTPINSSITAGDLVKNPFYGEHYYDSLIEALKAGGYVENQDLFVFPYDWRYGVSDDIVSELANRINVLAGNGKIDVIAHSMGGLLLKKVIQETGSQQIGKAIMVGVPNYGAAKTAKVLLYGDNLGIPWLAASEIKKIAQNMPAMYDLLPSQNTNAHSSYNQEAFSAARSLRTAEFDNLDLAGTGAEVFTLAGCGAPTLGELTEIRQPIPSLTLPLPLRNVMVSGDGTVPLPSAVGNSPADEVFYLLKPNHGKLPGQPGTTEVINSILVNDLPETWSSPLVTRDRDKCVLRGKLVSIFGQASVRIKSAAGNLIYPQAENSVSANVHETQVIELPNHTLIYLPEEELENILEMHSFVAGSPVSIQVDDAGEAEHGAAPEKIFFNLPPGPGDVLTLSGFGTEIVLSPELPTAPTEPPTADPPPSDSGPGSGSHSSNSGSSRKPRVLGRSTGSVNGTVLPHPEHSLINFGPTIYLIEYGQRRGFRSWGEFISHGFTAVQVQEGNTADWNLPEGLIMLAKPGILAWDLANPANLYFLNENVEKQWISGENRMRNWLNRINGVFNIDLTGYRVGLDIIN